MAATAGTVAPAEGPVTARRIAVLSDPHGDLASLAAVVADLEAAGHFDEVLLGGDLAQGGPEPAEVVDLIREHGWRSVRGNSDDLLVAVADGLPPAEPLPPAVEERARWSVERLGRDRIEYLRGLPLSIRMGEVLLVHATPWNNLDVVLPDAGEDVARRVLREAGSRVVIYGHIHQPYQRRIGDAWLASAGAVAGSNDADPRPAYTIVELSPAVRFQVRRVGP